MLSGLTFPKGIEVSQCAGIVTGVVGDPFHWVQVKGSTTEGGTEDPVRGQPGRGGSGHGPAELTELLWNKHPPQSRPQCKEAYALRFNYLRNSTTGMTHAQQQR